MTGRHVCTADDPWTPDKSGRATHPDAVLLRDEDGYPGGDVDVYRCPHCGLTFRVEVPQ